MARRGQRVAVAVDDDAQRPRHEDGPHPRRAGRRPAQDITNYRGAFTLGPCEDAGGFSVLYDEALEAQLKAEAEQAAPNRGAQRRGSQAGAKQAPSRFF